MSPARIDIPIQMGSEVPKHMVSALIATAVINSLDLPACKLTNTYNAELDSITIWAQIDFDFTVVACHDAQAQGPLYIYIARSWKAIPPVWDGEGRDPNGP